MLSQQQMRTNIPEPYCAPTNHQLLTALFHILTLKGTCDSAHFTDKTSKVQRGGMIWGQDLSYLPCVCLQGQ